MLFDTNKLKMPGMSDALPGRAATLPVPTDICQWPAAEAAFPRRDNADCVRPGLFLGAERKFWQLHGVYTTAVGYAGGYTPNPTYREVCSGMTGHNEVTLAVYEPDTITYLELLQVFWESHDPTQGMRQGNDVGTQYRSGIYTCTDEQKRLAIDSRDKYQSSLKKRGCGRITTEILDTPVFYYAEDYHQQYLAKNPGGYCGLGGTGIRFPQT